MINLKKFTSIGVRSSGRRRGYLLYSWYLFPADLPVPHTSCVWQSFPEVQNHPNYSKTLCPFSTPFWLYPKLYSIDMTIFTVPPFRLNNGGRGSGPTFYMLSINSLNCDVIDTYNFNFKRKNSWLIQKMESNGSSGSAPQGCLRTGVEKKLLTILLRVKFQKNHGLKRLLHYFWVILKKVAFPCTYFQNTTIKMWND